jgi:anti-anti-sigma regulatory factor
MYQIGLMDLEVFVVTLVAVLATDLIIGIAIGIAFKYALLLFKGTKLDELFKTKISMTETHEAISFNLEGAQIFSNYLSLKKQMDQALSRKPNLVLDFSKSTFIDHTVMEHLEDYVRLSKMKGKEVSISNIDVLNPLSNHPLAARDKKLKLVIKDASLSGRSIALFSYANINNYRFSNKVDRPESWQFYDFTIRKKWMEANNVISFYSNDLLFEIADIVTQTGADISADIDRITALKIKGLPNVPKFYMHKRSIMDTLHEFLENDEIKFSDYPEFSDRYALITDGQEKEVRDLLNFQLLSFLEEERNIFMSGNGEDLLIHLENKLLDVKEIDNLIHKAKDIISLIEFAEEVLRQ